jgi:hypothetical protein
MDFGETRDGKREVGVEFVEPSHGFWRVTFPPEDWSVHSPEAKRSSGQAITPMKQRPQSPPDNPLKK